MDFKAQIDQQNHFEYEKGHVKIKVDFKAQNVF